MRKYRRLKEIIVTLLCMSILFGCGKNKKLNKQVEKIQELQERKEQSRNQDDNSQNGSTDNEKLEVSEEKDRDNGNTQKVNTNDDSDEKPVETLSKEEESLQALRKEIKFKLAHCGIAYLSYGYGVGCSTFMNCTEAGNTYRMKYPFINDITIKQCVDSPGGYEVYCIVPKDADTKILVYEYNFDENGNAARGECIYEEIGTPILLCANYSDIMPNTTVVIEENGSEFEFQPCLELKEGKVSRPESGKIYDFTDYDIVEMYHEPTRPETIYMPESPFGFYQRAGVQSGTELLPICLDTVSKKKNDIADEYNFISEYGLYDYDVLNDIVPYDIVDIDGGNYQSYTVNNYYTLGDYAYCIYGDSPMSRAYKLAIYDANNYNMIFDLDFTGFRYLPNCENNMFVEQEIRWAQIEDGILYVATSHRTYAESSDYVNGFITALDMYNNFEVIWQTESLVCNSRNFIILDQNIVCGYGFTEEKDYLVEIDKTNGEVVDKVLLDSMVEFIYYKENRMYVRTYDTNYVFEVSFG